MIKAGTWFQWKWCLGFLVVMAWTPAAFATPPSTPITVELELSQVPNLNEWAMLTIEVQSLFDAPNTFVELILPEGVVTQTTTWLVDLLADIPVTLTGWAFFQEPGNQTVSARALNVMDSGAIWGDMKSIPLYISPAGGVGELGWKVDHVPVAALAKRGDTDPISMEPTPFSFPAAVEEVPSPEELPSVEPRRAPASAPRLSIPSSPGTVTLTGKWQYRDRSGVARDLDQQLLEIRRGDGSALSPRTFCFTDVDGSFSCSFPHPGTTMRIWARSWTNFSTGPTRLGVFWGIEIPGSCGSDSIDCSYPVETGEISCGDGQTCNTGTHTIGTTEPWSGAHQMTQDLIRSWKRLRFDTRHPSGTTAGPARITYPVPAGHGTHAHVGGVYDGWISIEPPSQQSADIVTHEYGHVVMSNLWVGYSPTWPTTDCPSPHYIDRVSGPGCALSEGFADFWAWYSNQFYDGDSSTANDGPIFNWQPGIGGTNMETRDGGTYETGDQVEGNVAGALGDMYDTTNDGPTTGPADRLSDGIQHIWHVTFSQSDNNFSEWWTAYWSTFGHEPCPALEILQFNTIPYILSQCAPSSLSINDVTVTEGNSGTVNAVFTVSLSPASPQTVTVNFATANGTATAPSDYTATNGTLTFAPGTTTQNITVQVIGDTVPELNETFFVNLSGATNATIADNQGVGTIANDDPQPSLSINDMPCTEGNSSTTPCTFTVTLSPASSQTVTVQYATANGTATAGSDYQATSGILTFNPGETAKPITVLVNGDTVFELNETFFVNLSGATNATIADNQGVGTIANDDPQPSLSITDVTANEGNSSTTPFTFTVTLSPASPQTVTVNFATANGTATAPSDYTATNGTLTFAPGSTTQNITVLVNGDTVPELNETFFVNLSTPTNAIIVDSQGLGTITNDDKTGGSQSSHLLDEATREVFTQVKTLAGQGQPFKKVVQARFTLQTFQRLPIGTEVLEPTAITGGRATIQLASTKDPNIVSVSLVRLSLEGKNFSFRPRIQGITGILDLRTGAFHVSLSFRRLMTPETPQPFTWEGTADGVYNFASGMVSLTEIGRGAFLTK